LADASLARPYAYDPVRQSSAPAEWLPAFEVDAGLPAPVLESARSQAQAAGYATGWAQGVREAKAQMAADAESARLRAEQTEAQRVAAITRGLGALDRAVTELERRALPTVEQIEDTVVEMAVAIAEAVLGHELRRRNDRVVIQAMARILALAPANEDVTIRLSPQDHAALQAAEVVAGFGSNRTISLIAAPELSPGDAVAICGATEIDGRIQPALQRLRELLGADDDGVVERRAAR
jgi:flagellar assembly protein FliH